MKHMIAMKPWSIVWLLWRSSFIALRHSQTLIAMEHSLIALKYSLIALKHSLIALKHSLIALRHRLIAMKHSLIALKHSLIASKHSLIALKYSLMTLKHKLMPSALSHFLEVWYFVSIKNAPEWNCTLCYWIFLFSGSLPLTQMGRAAQITALDNIPILTEKYWYLFLILPFNHVSEKKYICLNIHLELFWVVWIHRWSAKVQSDCTDMSVAIGRQAKTILFTLHGCLGNSSVLASGTLRALIWRSSHCLFWFSFLFCFLFYVFLWVIV